MEFEDYKPEDDFWHEKSSVLWYSSSAECVLVLLLQKQEYIKSSSENNIKE